MQNFINDCLLWPDDRAKATFKCFPEDFIVHEQLSWTFTGRGEHLFLYVEKTNCNTVWVAKQLARFYGVPPRDVGYSGLKDRHAVTRQYFSIRLPGIKPGGYELPEHGEYQVISHQLHDKKLKRGNHPYNDFTITLRDVDGDRSVIDKHLAFVRDHGCPNLFDQQRFGNDNRNLDRLQQWINGDIEVRKGNEKSLLLSTLRSLFFNRQLGERVKANNWQEIIAGDTVMLAGSNSHFTPEVIDDTLKQRAADHDIHPAGILIGEGDNLETLTGFDAEKANAILKNARMETGYRPLRLIVANMDWAFSADQRCTIHLRLPKGAYASGVIKQVFDCG